MVDFLQPGDYRKARKLGLSRWTSFVTSRLELVAVPVFRSVVCFLLGFFQLGGIRWQCFRCAFFERTRSAAGMRPRLACFTSILHTHVTRCTVIITRRRRTLRCQTHNASQFLLRSKYSIPIAGQSVQHSPSYTYVGTATPFGRDLYAEIEALLAFLNNDAESISQGASFIQRRLFRNAGRSALVYGQRSRGLTGWVPPQCLGLVGPADELW